MKEPDELLVHMQKYSLSNPERAKLNVYASECSGYI